MNFLRRHRTRTTKYKERRQKQAVKAVKQSLNSRNKVHFAYGKHACPQLPNESLKLQPQVRRKTCRSVTVEWKNTVHHNPTAAKGYH